MNKKILLVSWTVYPQTSGSSVIVSNLAKGLGKDRVVVAGERPESSPKRPWAAESDVPLIYLDPFILPMQRGRRFSKWLGLARVTARLREIIHEHGITHVLAIFPDEFYCYAALKAARLEGVGFSIWLHNSYLENREGLMLRLARVLQPRFFDSAKTVFTMSDGLSDELSRRYPDQAFTTLVHGFEIDQNPQVDVAINGPRTSFVYSGNLNHSCEDASIRQLRVILEREDTEIHIFSGSSEPFERRGIKGDRVHFHGFRPLADFVAGLKDYDIMLLPHGIDGLRSDFEYRTIFPTRTIPLLFSGKPIFAHSPENSFLTQFLRRYDCAALVTEKSEAALATTLNQLMTDAALRERLVKSAVPAANQFSLPVVTKKVWEHCGT
ncbi:hypothetical protein CEQ90_06665 [Lewinellaceae bacterium SD302]|nr:hypothetical protein CEQ90_06665 [Lewinellaceae bacterium SD302]